MSEATAHNNSSAASQAPPSMTTEAFQKHYGRGSAAYPSNPPHTEGGQSYHNPHFAPPPNEPSSRDAPQHGYAHAPSWYYQQHQHGAPPPPQQQFPSPHNNHDTLAPLGKRNNASHRGSAPPELSPPMVTPKESDDVSDSMPNLPSTQTKTTSTVAARASKKRPTRSTKQQSSITHKSSSSTKDSYSAAAAMEEEIHVEPMKQDFYFYANDRFDDVKAQCEEECKQSSSGGRGKSNNKENELYRLTTLMNARLIQDWESGPASLRAEYMKMEDSDRQRFMSEEEVASRHCATLTARKRSPKQQQQAAEKAAGASSNSKRSNDLDYSDGVVDATKRARV